MPAFCVPGARVLAVGWHAGVRKTFEADVVAIRPRFPRVHVRYAKCVETGQTSRLALPTPAEAYVHAGAVSQL